MSDPADEFFDLLHGVEGQPENQEPDPADIIRQQCAMWVEAAGRWRFQDLPRPNAQASPSQVRDALVEVRARLDSLEIIFGQSMSLKAATATQAAELEHAAEDAWDLQAQAEQRRPRPEFQGSRERYAFWNIAIRDERRCAREARALADLVRSTHDQVKLYYEGLNETRRDLVSRLTHFRWESHMES